MSAGLENSESLSAVELRELIARLVEGNSQSHLLPISSAQQRLWFLDQLEPESPRYNIPSILWLAGKLDVPALECTLRTIVERHESLRARFISEDGEPAQVIDAPDSFQLRREDLSRLPAAQRDVVAQRMIKQEAGTPFCLSEGRLIRATLFRLAPEEHVLVINMHHIVSDAWSFKLFYSELETLYAGQVSGRAAVLPELPIQYSDYAAWQREWLGSEDFEKQLAFWKGQMAGNPSLVNLPVDRPRRLGGSARSSLSVAMLPPALSHALGELALRHGATMFIILLAALKTLLHRLTGQEDIVVGSPMAGRKHVETEELIGFFANTLPLRTHVSGAMSFEQLLNQVREMALGAYSNQDVPFDKLVEALHPERTPGQTPFINVLFLYQTDLAFLELPGLELNFLDLPPETAKFDLTLFAADGEDGLALGIEFNAELFNDATIERLLQNFESLLHSIVGNPAQPLSKLPLFDNPEQRPLSNGTPLPGHELAPWQFLDQWFEARSRSASQPNGAAAVPTSNSPSA
jgi:hypothetical protein